MKFSNLVLAAIYTTPQGTKIMAKHLEIAQKGEDLAWAYLERKGYHLAERNWRAGHGELDLVVWTPDRSILVFAEVKTRKKARFGYPEDAVTAKKKEKIMETAAAYQRSIDYWMEIRFDIISLILEPKLEIRHFEDAFFPHWGEGFTSTGPVY